MDSIVLSLGSNLGDRAANLQHAHKALEDSGITIRMSSGIYETEPYGMSDQPAFLNQVLLVETTDSPGQVLKHCLSIESAMGRVRGEKNGPRIIDLDLLLYGDEVISEHDLNVPHPGIPDRKFVLVPLAEIAGEHRHPVLGKTMNQLLDECGDTLIVKPYLVSLELGVGSNRS